MDMIVHQYIRMKPTIAMMQGIAQQVQVAEPVAIVEKARQPVVASLHDVLRNAGKRDAR